MQSRFAFMPSPSPRRAEAPTHWPGRSMSPAPGRRRGREAHPHDAILALDIETVPDIALIPEGWPADRFPKAAWHRVVAISFVAADILRGPNGREAYTVTCCRSGGEETWDERRLLGAFWRFFADGRYRLVTWNGRAFDMPTILARSMLHGVDASPWFSRGTKWDGYRHRFAQDWHTDLMDVMSDNGATQRMTLEEAAALIGLPGKLGEHGSEVATMVASGDIERVRAYCETDCLNLMVLYVRWAHLSGRIEAAAHDRAILELIDLLERARAARPHLGRFLDAWKDSSGDRRRLLAASPAPG